MNCNTTREGDPNSHNGRNNNEAAVSCSPPDGTISSLDGAMEPQPDGDASPPPPPPSPRRPTGTIPTQRQYPFTARPIRPLPEPPVTRAHDHHHQQLTLLPTPFPFHPNRNPPPLPSLPASPPPSPPQLAQALAVAIPAADLPTLGPTAAHYGIYYQEFAATLRTLDNNAVVSERPVRLWRPRPPVESNSFPIPRRAGEMWHPPSPLRGVWSSEEVDDGREGGGEVDEDDDGDDEEDGEDDDEHVDKGFWDEWEEDREFNMAINY